MIYRYWFENTWADGTFIDSYTFVAYSYEEAINISKSFCESRGIDYVKSNLQLS